MFCRFSARGTAPWLASERTFSFVSIGRDPVVQSAVQHPEILLPKYPRPGCRLSRARVRAQPGGSALQPIIVLPSSELRGFAPSREPVVLAHLAPGGDAAQAGLTGSGQEREPGEACPRPARIVKRETASNIFARPLCLRAFVVWSVVAK